MPPSQLQTPHRLEFALSPGNFIVERSALNSLTYMTSWELQAVALLTKSKRILLDAKKEAVRSSGIGDGNEDLLLSIIRHATSWFKKPSGYGRLFLPPPKKYGGYSGLGVAGVPPKLSTTLPQRGILDHDEELE